MANLNLSEFGEKTFVADTDWTFVWDTAGAISKKVSRNSLLNSGTLTTSAPITVSQTWNDAAVAFTALKVNATSTNSATASKLLDLQVGGVSRWYIQKDGATLFSTDSSATFGNAAETSTTAGIWSSTATQELRLSVNAKLGWTAASTYGTPDTILLRDGAANTLALRNGAAAQTFRVYNTYTDASNYRRLEISSAGSEMRILSQGAGTGSPATFNLGIGNSPNWQITTSGHFIGYTDNTYDIGASGANRPRNIYAGGNIQAAGFQVTGSGIAALGHNGSAITLGSGSWPTQLNGSAFLIGGGTDAFPAIVRDGAGIKITGAAGGLTSHIKVPAVAVGSLPSATTAGVGARAFVNDALSPVFGSAVANGGSAKVPVYSDGSAWYVG